MWEKYVQLLHNVKWDSINRANLMFRIQYYCSTIILLACYLFVLIRENTNMPIMCEETYMGQQGLSSSAVYLKLLDAMLQTYCYLDGVYTIPKSTATIGKKEVYPGVSPHEPGDETRRYLFYVYIDLFLLFQAFCFYLPARLWKRRENGLIRKLTQKYSHSYNEEYNEQTHQTIVQYFMGSLKLQNSYALAYYSCELLTLVNVTAQIVITSWFIDGDLVWHAISALLHENLHFYQRGVYVENTLEVSLFPTIAQCAYYQYGSSGTIETIEVMCVLPFNVSNRKVFLLLCVWFFIIYIMSLITFLYRMAYFMLKCVKLWRLKMCAPGVSSSKLRTILNSCGMGNLFILHQLSKNMDGVVYEGLLEALHSRLLEIRQPPEDNNISEEEKPAEEKEPWEVEKLLVAEEFSEIEKPIEMI